MTCARVGAFAAVAGVVLLPCGHAGEAAANSSDGSAQKKEDGITVRPVLLDEKGSASSTLGLEYEINRKWTKAFSSGSAPSDGFEDANKPLWNGFIQFDAKGTVATNADRNPKDLTEAELDAGGRWSGSWGTMSVSLNGKFETDQRFDNKQGVYGLTASYGKYGVLSRNDSLEVDIGRGRVDPTDDAARATALGVTKPDPYYRNHLEAEYILNLGRAPVETLEVNYRLFRETGAPSAIRSAKLDEFQLVTYRLGLIKGYFVAYSVGKLPFDQKKDQFYEVGFSYTR